LAWSYYDLLKWDALAYALNNLNRSISSNNASIGKAGIKIENPVGGNGARFQPGPFGRMYLAGNLPIS
jgi:hypothetical protein